MGPGFFFHGHLMKIGVNWTSPRHLPIVRSFLAEGKISYCEVMIDNFLHLTPAAVAEAFPGAPIAFHIMNSQFIRRSPDELKALAVKLKAFIRELRPMYVSDHLAVFTHEGRRLPFPQEIDYRREQAQTLGRVKLWQDLMETPLIFENYPSIAGYGEAQPAFLDTLMRETGAGLLLDLSNAVVAQKNCGVPLAAWLPLVKRAQHFHAAGYRSADTKPEIIQDSHDCELSDDTLGFLRLIKPEVDGRDCSIVVERDANIEPGSWSKDISAVRSAFL
jgi:uncharacterized protein (UPF0276 family)